MRVGDCAPSVLPMKQNPRVRRMTLPRPLVAPLCGVVSSFHNRRDSMPRCYRANHAYQGDARASQLSFAAGALLVASDDTPPNNGWILGYIHPSSQHRGWFPASYVTMVDNNAPPPPQQQPDLFGAGNDGGFGGSAMGGNAAIVNPTANVVNPNKQTHTTLRNNNEPTNPPNWPAQPSAASTTTTSNPHVDFNDDQGGFGGAIMGGAPVGPADPNNPSAKNPSAAPGAPPKKDERFITIAPPPVKQGFFKGMKKKITGSSKK